MFKITKDILKKDLLENTKYSKEAAEFLSVFLLNKNNYPNINMFFGYSGSLEKVTSISFMYECIEDFFEEVKKKYIYSFIKGFREGFDVNHIIYESNNIIIYKY